ncbi:hypothetical protein D3H34_17855 [Acidovorax cavernicola]|uniref:Uncharacterized protein n=1 Tax=Acidovorax cavernicola TaxID=1675792 RepID=A0A9X8D385_9BURK|nr:hypothetical protein D3H34_17855 [Acidovorax cavernicola]
MRAPQVARSAAKGRRQQGRLSFAYFSLAKQRKVGRPPGRDPAPESKPTQPSIFPNRDSRSRLGANAPADSRIG